MPLEQLEELAGVEAGHGDHGRARAQWQGQGDQEPHDVGERRHGEQGVALADAQPGGDLAHRGDQVGVGQPDPLGQPGGAARVGEQGDRGGRVEGRARVGGVTADSQQVEDRGGALGLAEHHHLAGPGGGRGRTGRRDQRRDGHQDRGAGVGQLGGQLALGAGRAGAGHGPAGGHGPQGDPGPLGQVRRPQGEHVPGSEAGGGQPGRHPLDPLGQQPVADRRPRRPVHQGRPVPEAVGGGEDHPVQGRAADLDRRVRAGPHAPDLLSHG